MAATEEGNLMDKDEALIWDRELKRIGDNFDDIFVDTWKYTDNELLDQVGDLLDPRSYPELEQLPPSDPHLLAFSLPKPNLLPSTSKSDSKPTSMASDCGTASTVRPLISSTKSATTTTTRVNSDDCGTRKEVTQSSLSYTDKVELSKRKLKEGYDQYKQSRKKLRVIGVNDIPSKPSRALPTVNKRVVGGRKSSTDQNKDCQKKRSPPCAPRKECSVGSSTEQKNYQKRSPPCAPRNYCIKSSSDQNKDCHKSLNDTRKECIKSSDGVARKVPTNDIFSLSYAERMVLAKRKLQEGYDQCNESRKKTRLIEFNDIPSNPCRVLPKVKRLAAAAATGGGTVHYSIPVPRKVCGF